MHGLKRVAQMRQIGRNRNSRIDLTPYATEREVGSLWPSEVKALHFVRPQLPHKFHLLGGLHAFA